jgi:hypothetical protein
VVVEDSISDKAGFSGGEEVVMDEAAFAEGAEAGARGDQGGVCGGGKRSRSGRGRERLEEVEGGREMAGVVKMENGAIGVLHLRRSRNPTSAAVEAMRPYTDKARLVKCSFLRLAIMQIIIQWYHPYDTIL